MSEENKTAVVTGGSRGIGRAAARLLAENGYSVVINYSGSEAAAVGTVEELRGDGLSVEAMKCDVSDSEACKAFFSEVKTKYGGIDVLVNNAGITRDNLIMRMSSEDFDRVLNVNLRGCFNCIKEVSSVMMKQRSGRIINISSVVGITGNAGQANYAASKAGVIGLTKSAAKELASRGITVNAVAPGYIETDMTQSLSEKIREAILGQVPLGRVGKPEDVAEAILFLASDAGSYITGQVIKVDGGMVI